MSPENTYRPSEVTPPMGAELPISPNAPLVNPVEFMTHLAPTLGERDLTDEQKSEVVAFQKFIIAEPPAGSDPTQETRYLYRNPATNQDEEVPRDVAEKILEYANKLSINERNEIEQVDKPSETDDTTVTVKKNVWEDCKRYVYKQGAISSEGIAYAYGLSGRQAEAVVEQLQVEGKIVAQPDDKGRFAVIHDNFEVSPSERSYATPKLKSERMEVEDRTVRQSRFYRFIGKPLTAQATETTAYFTRKYQREAKAAARAAEQENKANYQSLLAKAATPDSAQNRKYKLVLDESESSGEEPQVDHRQAARPMNAQTAQNRRQQSGTQAPKSRANTRQSAPESHPEYDKDQLITLDRLVADAIRDAAHAEKDRRHVDKLPKDDFLQIIISEQSRVYREYTGRDLSAEEIAALQQAVRAAIKNQ